MSSPLRRIYSQNNMAYYESLVDTKRVLFKLAIVFKIDLLKFKRITVL